MRGVATNVALKIVTPPQEIRTLILAEMLKKLSAHTAALRKQFHTTTQIWLKSTVEKSQTWQELLGGRLRKELGIANPHEVTDQIMRVWLDSVRITYPGPIFNGKKIQSLILIDAIIADFSDVKSIGSYISENSRGKQTPVDWLEWLVTRGKKVIIHTHAPVSGPYGQWSRTGNTIMKESVNEQYSVTPPHDGVPGNNFVTRALKQNMSQLESALNEAFYKVVK